MPYFNYRVHSNDLADAGYWERRDFLNAWWSLQRDDNHWTPPVYRRLAAQLNPRHNEHLARLQAGMVHVDALYRTGVRRSRTDQQEIPLTSVLEKPLAAAVAVVDARRKGRTAHLALLHLANDEEAFDRLHYHLVELFSYAGFRRAVGPVGLSPHLDSGVLVDNWHEWSPAHTPSNPPYLPELLERRYSLLQTGRLFHASVPAAVMPPAGGPTQIITFDPGRLATDLLPLLVYATENLDAGFPAPDAIEAAFLLQALDAPSLIGLLAQIAGQPVGFALLGPDTSGRLRAARGGRPLWGRAWLGLAGHRRAPAGRVYFAAVLPDQRRQGIGRQLWRQCLRLAGTLGWATLTAGPLWSPGAGDTPAELFLRSEAAEPRQTYHLYQWSF